MTEPLRIAVLMGQDADFYRKFLLGVHAYASHGKRWHFRNAPPTMTVLGPLVEWNPDGIIAKLDNADLARRILKLGKPTIDAAFVLEGLGVPAIDADPIAIGKLAAKYFLARGYRNFGYFGSGDAYYSKLRCTGFRQLVEQAGFEVCVCHIDYFPRLTDRTSWKMVDTQIEKWLRGMSMPMAVLAAHDVMAHDLVEMCQLLGLRVPNDVAVLGVDNDELECQLAFPPISSVALPSERLGFKAAELLDQMLSGESVPNDPVYLPPVCVVTRQSTSIFAVDEPMVSAALHYIRNHFAEPLSVSLIAAALTVSRRDLDQKFHSLLGHSLHSEILSVRVEKANELLANTDLPMSKVAKQTGFSSPQYMATVFRKVVGLAPCEYRHQMCAPLAEPSSHAVP